ASGGDAIGTIYTYSDDALTHADGTSGYGYLTQKTLPDTSFITYTNHWSADQPRYVKEYSTAGVLLITKEYDSAGVLVGQTDTSAIYTYYTVSGRVNTKELLVASGGDAIGTIYTYSDDALTHADGTSGYGYLTQKTFLGGSYITYTDHWSPDKPRYVKEYSSGGTLLVTREYDANGVIISQIEQDGTVYDYYASGRMDTKTLPSGIVYEYTDENYLGEGYGLLTKETATDGSYKIFMNYYTGTRQARYIKEYNSAGTLLVTYEYDSEGDFTGKTETDGTVYSVYSSGRIKSKSLTDGTIYDYLDEAFYDNGTPTDATDDYGRLYKVTTSDSKVYTYEAYYSDTDLKAKVTEENTDYPGTIYYYYDSYSDSNANEIGYRKIDSNSGQELDYKKRNGQSTIYYKKDPDGSEYWYLWDMPVDSDVWPSLPGWSMLAKQDPSGNWYVYPFDPNSSPNNPVVSWSLWEHATALDPSNQAEFSLSAWPPAPIDNMSMESALLGTSALDVLSMLEAESLNQEEFTGYSVIDESYNDPNEE
ncbi:MAG: hypothetical protein KKG84_02865, partial [Candidatus Omnitrophica bacterium]|nr:hypothetical protein [Candidatus Omnitrophota bacterium]